MYRLTVGCLALLLLTPALYGQPVQRKGDLYGDPLPKHAVSRLGTVRYRLPDQVQGVLFLKDSNTLLVPSGHGKLHFCMADTGQVIQTMFLPGNIQEYSLSPDRETIALINSVFGNDTVSFSLHIVDANTGVVRKSIELARPTDPKLALSDGARRFAIASNTSVSYWDGTTVTELSQKAIDDRRQRISALAISPDGNLVAMGTRNLVQIWNLTDDQVTTLLDSRNQRGAPTRASSMAFSPDGSKLAVTFDFEFGARLFDVTTKKSIGTIRRHGDARAQYRAVTFSPDGNSLILANYRSRDRAIDVWDIPKRAFTQAFTAPDGVYQVDMAPDGKVVAGVVGWNAGVGVWDVATGKQRGTDAVAHDRAPSQIHFFANDTKIATAGDDGTIRIWERESGRQLKILSHLDDINPRHTTRWIRAMVVSPDSKWIATSSLDDTVRLWEIATGKLIYHLPGHGRLGGKRTLKFSPDSSRFVSWGDDLYTHVWDLKTGKALKEYRFWTAGTEPADRRDGRRTIPVW